MTQTYAGNDFRPAESGGRPPPLSEKESTRRIANMLGFIIGACLIVGILYLFSDVVLLVFGAVLLAAQLSGLSRLLHRYVRLPYGLALALVVLSIIIVVLLFAYILGPRVIREGKEVYDDISAQLAALMAKHGGHPDWVDHIADRIRAYFSKKGGSFAGEAASFVSGTIGNVGSIALIVVAGIYLAISPDVYIRGSVRLFPQRLRPRVEQIFAKETRALRRWFVGQLIDMITIGALTMIGLYFIGVPLWFTLGCIAGLCNFVPYLGALAGSVPAILVALSQSPTEAFYVAGLFCVVQAFEGNVTSPLIARRTVDLPPVLTLMSQTVLGSLFGLFGLIFATPIVAIGLVLVRTAYVEDTLGDSMDKQVQLTPPGSLPQPAR